MAGGGGRREGFFQNLRGWITFSHGYEKLAGSCGQVIRRN